MLLENEKIEPLGNNINIIVSKEYHFSTDTILLANFSNPKKKDKAIELGSGCGTIPLIWCRNAPPKQIYMVEIQTQATEMIKRSIKLNKLENEIHVINEDLNNLKGKVPFGYFDLVVCNPPYKVQGTGILNPNKKHEIARHEIMCSNDDIVKCASKLLNFGGRFCLCQRTERLADIMESFRQHGIEPKKLRLVQQRKNKAPKLFLIEGKKGANKGGLVIENTLLIEDDNGNYSSEMMEIYNYYKENY